MELSELDAFALLILHAILNHARSQETEVKALLSGNVKEFGKSNVLETLRDAGVGKYFARTKDFMGWLQSHTNSV